MALLSLELYNKMMQKTEVWEILCEKQSDIDFQITLRRNEIHLILTDPTQTVLALANNQTSTLYRTLIRDYQFKSIATDRALFKRKDEKGFNKLQEAVEILSTFVESFTQLRLRYSQQRQQSMLAIQRELKPFHPEIGFKKRTIHTEEKQKQVHLLCLKSKSQQILNIIRDCSHFVRESLLFPLNAYILPAIQHSNYPIFISKMVALHREDIVSRVEMYLKETDEVGNLTIQNISEGFAQLEDHDKKKNKDHAKGIYGVSLTVLCKDYLLSKLFCMLEIYFGNLRYAVKTLKDLPESSCSQIEEQYKSKGITTFFLNPYQLVILRPPLQIEQMIKDLDQRKWLLNQESYLSFDFSIIAKHSKLFITRLKARNIEFSHLKMKQKQIQFVSDINAFNKIQKQCKDFLFDTITVEESIDLFNNEFEMNVYSEYYLPKIINTFAELLWIKDKAVLKTFKKDLVDVYNAIASNYHEMRKEIIELPWHESIYLPLVRLIQEKTKIEDYQSCRYAYQSQFFVTIRSVHSIYKEDFGVFIVNDLKRASELNEFLLINNKKADLVQTCSTLEINSQNSKQFNSILFWKICQRGKLIRQCDLQKFLQMIVQRKQGLKLILPDDFEGYILDFLNEAVYYIFTNRAQLQLKQLTLFIPRSLTSQRSRELQQKLNLILHRDLQFNRINSSYLSQRDMLRLSCWSHAQLTCTFKDQNIECSPLTSFIFFTQIRRKIKHKFALFVPRKKCNKEYLIYLYGLQIYEIKPQGVCKVKPRSSVEKRVERMARIVSSYFKNQNYFLLATDIQSQQLPQPIIYVCDSTPNQPRTTSTLSKYEIDLINDKIFSCNSSISYFFQELPPARHIMLQTHPQYLPTLLPHMRP